MISRYLPSVQLLLNSKTKNPRNHQRLRGFFFSLDKNTPFKVDWHFVLFIPLL